MRRGRDANVDAKSDGGGKTVLDEAAAGEHGRVVRLLLEHKTGIDAER